MLNIIWLSLMLIAVIFGVINGKTVDVVNAVTEYAKLSFELALGLAGIMSFWMGIMTIAEDSGLVAIIARATKPIMKLLFPEIEEDHPALGSMMLNITANMLGLANAATPLGLRAMQDLETLNKYPGVATNSMCTFLALNTSSLQLIPMTAIAFMAANGAEHPTAIIASALLATSCSTIAAIIAVKTLSKLKCFQIKVSNKD